VVELEFKVESDCWEIVADEQARLTCCIDVRIDPDSLVDVPTSSNTHICMVLDCSGSMAGESIEGAMKAAKRIVDCASEENTISLVAFESRAHSLLEGVRATAKGKAAMHQKIDRLHKLVGGTTAMSEGIRCGMQAMRGPDADAKVMIVLSDGVANVPARAAKAAEDAAQEGIQLYAVGLGTACAYLDRLVAPSNGTVFRNDEAADLVGTFTELFERIESFVASNVFLEMELTPGVTPGETVRVRPDKTSIGTPVVDAGALRLNLGNIERGEEYRYEMPLSLPPLAAGDHRLLEARLIYDVPSVGAKRQQRQDDLWVTSISFAAQIAKEEAEKTAAAAAEAEAAQRSGTEYADASDVVAAVGDGDRANTLQAPEPFEELDVEPQRGPDLYDVMLIDAGDEEILVFREVRDATGVSLRYVRDLLRLGGGALKSGLELDVAEALCDRIATTGARVEVHPTRSTRSGLLHSPRSRQASPRAGGRRAATA